MSVSRAPLKSGTIINAVLPPAGTASATNPPVSNLGYAMLTQTGLITQASTAAVSYLFYLPALSQITRCIVDVLVAYDSATSSTLSIGATAGGTEYASGVDCKTAAGRIEPTLTAAQLVSMSSTPATTQTANVNPYSAVYATVTVVGATTAGSVRVTIQYVQKDA